MEHNSNDKLALFEALQANGWHLEDNCLYSPSGGIIRLQGTAYVEAHLVKRMYERTQKVLDEMLQSKPINLDTEQHKNHIQDLESVVNTLKEFLDKQ